MKMKKFTAVILALVMIFAMSANAFAAGNSTTSVEIQMYGEEAYTVSVTDQDISSLCGNASHLYTVPTHVTDALTSYTPADALIAAYMLTYDINNTSDIGEDVISYAWHDVSEENEPTHYGLYFATYEGLSADAGQYYLVSTRYDEEGTAYYTYYWAGDAWNLYINGAFAEEYSSEYDLSNVSSIRFDYNTVTSETFETTTPISGALSAPNN